MRISKEKKIKSLVFMSQTAKVELRIVEIILQKLLTFYVF